MFIITLSKEKDSSGKFNFECKKETGEVISTASSSIREAIEKTVLETVEEALRWDVDITIRRI